MPLVDIVCRVTRDIVVTIDSEFTQLEIEELIKKGSIVLPLKVGDISTYSTDDGEEYVGNVTDISQVEIEPVTCFWH